MTEHLTTLLAREAENLDVPPAPAADILGAGRRLRRRRTGTAWAGAALTLAVIAGGVVLVGTRGGDQRVAPVNPTPPPVSMAWATGDTVYAGTSGRPVAMPEVAQTLYLTSAGVLVRTNKDGSSDGGAPFHFELVTDAGDATKLGVTLGDVVPSTDPTQAYLAWATMSGGKIQVVVHDVATDKDVATVDVPGTFSWGGWEAPPVALSGDDVYVGTNGPTTVVNWRTGEASTSSVLPKNYFPEVHGGRTVMVKNQGKKDAEADVVDAATGRDLLQIPIQRFDQVNLSPDGRFALVTGQGFDPPVTMTVYDVDTSRSAPLPSNAFGYGWSWDDELFQVKGDQLSVCSPTTGDCQQSSVPKIGGRELVRYTGVIFES